jgi:hypothetical protein
MTNKQEFPRALLQLQRSFSIVGEQDAICNIYSTAPSVDFFKLLEIVALSEGDAFKENERPLDYEVQYAKSCWRSIKPDGRQTGG